MHGRSETGGILQLCVDSKIGLVCGKYWSRDEARVLCRSLGYPSSGKVDINNHYNDSY